MNAYIINTQIFQLNKYDLKGHKSSSNFRFNPTLHLLDIPFDAYPYKLCGSLPLFLSRRSPLIALNANLWMFSSLFLHILHLYTFILIQTIYI